MYFNLLQTDTRLTLVLCFRITFPKNAVPNKALIRLSVMDIQEVPFTSKSSVTSDRIPNLLPISAAISMEPQNLVLQKPVTVR